MEAIFPNTACYGGIRFRCLIGWATELVTDWFTEWTAHSKTIWASRSHKIIFVKDAIHTETFHKHQIQNNLMQYFLF